MSYIESGHAKNTANFDHIITIVQSYGTNYSPSNGTIAVPNLQSALTNAQVALTNVKNEYTAWKNATNNREIAFEALKGLSTRLLNTLIAVGANEQTINDFKTLNAKMQGARLTKIEVEKAQAPTQEITGKTALPQQLPPKKTISVSQQSFDNIIEHLDKLIKLLASVPAYNPTETALKVVTLQATLVNLKTTNTAAYSKKVSLANARIARSRVLYENPDSLLALTKAVKAYVKGKFGAGSAEYKQLSEIRISKINTGK